MPYQNTTINFGVKAKFDSELIIFYISSYQRWIKQLIRLSLRARLHRLSGKVHRYKRVWPEHTLLWQFGMSRLDKVKKTGSSKGLTCARYSRDLEKIAILSVNFLSLGVIFFSFFFDRFLDHYLIFSYLKFQVIWLSFDKRNNWPKKRFKKWLAVFIAHRLRYSN